MPLPYYKNMNLSLIPHECYKIATMLEWIHDFHT